MYKRVLFATDLEGVNNVVGEPYSGLTRQLPDWEVARNQIVKEINAGAEALFKIGVEKIGLWDGHGGGGNIDPSLVDSRIDFIPVDPRKPRLEFAENEFDCVCYFGYHTMEGTLGGVLAHTMSSKEIQYYKIHGKLVGEIDIDSMISAHIGMPSRLFVGGDLTCNQAKRTVEDIVTVVTKTELGRNKAIFRDNDELFADIKEKIVQAVTTEGSLNKPSFPLAFEKSFKRVEDAEKYLARLKEQGVCANYLADETLGYDAHTVVSTAYDISDFRKCI